MRPIIWMRAAPVKLVAISPSRKSARQVSRIATFLPSVRLSLARAATLAGSLMPFGSIASLIVVQQTKSRDGGVGFGEFVRVGLVVTLVTTAAAMAILAVEYAVGLHP